MIKNVKSIEKFYKSIVPLIHPNEPQTLEEYLQEDNRFLYFDISTYVKIMKYLNIDDELFRFIVFINVLQNKKNYSNENYYIYIWY